MRIKSLRIFGWVTLIAGILSCAETEDDLKTRALDTSYFPLNSSKRIYQVRHISFDLLGSDTAQYQLRESIGDTIFNPEGDVSGYILKREIRQHTSEIWVVDSLWTVRLDGMNLVVTENNQAYVKLNFPVITGKQWDGNAYNIMSSQTYRYLQTERLNSNAGYDTLKTITVSIADIPANQVNQHEHWETYGEGIGLLEKDYIRLNFCTISCDSIGQIEGGNILSQYLIAYDR